MLETFLDVANEIKRHADELNAAAKACDNPEIRKELSCAAEGLGICQRRAIQMWEDTVEELAREIVRE